MGHPLDGPRAKLRRGNLHLDALERQIEAAFKGRAYTTVRESYPERGYYVFRAKVNRPINAGNMGLALGDAAHNFRSALDHLVWQLSYGPRIDGIPAPNPKDRSQWPISDHGPDFDSRGVQQIRQVQPRAAAIIRAVQPYHLPDPSLHPLALVRELDNTDKHRLIPVVAAVFDTIQQVGPLKIDAGKAIDMFVSTNAVEDGVELATVQLPETNPQFQPDYKFTFGVKLAEFPSTGMRVPYVVPALRSGC